MPWPRVDFSGAVDPVADALKYRILKSNKEKENYEAALSRIEALSKTGVKGGQIVPIDPNVKDKDIIPFVNKKAYEDLKTNTRMGVAAKAAEAKVLYDIGIVNMRQQLQQQARQQAQPMTTEAVVPGGPLRTFPQSQAAQQDLQKEAARQRAIANVPKEKRADTALEISKEHLDIAKSGLKLRTQGARERYAASQPETKMFNETGVSPQMFVEHVKTGDTTLGQQGYEVYAPEGMKVAEFPPLKAGESLKDVRRRPSAWAEFFTLGHAGSTSVRPSFVAKSGGPYREKEYKYSSYTSKDPTASRPESVKYAPHPEGEYLRIGEKRVKFDDAVGVMGMVERRKNDALQALKTLPLPVIKERLQDLGYDPNDDYWGLPK